MLEELGDTCEATLPDCSVSSCHFIWSIHPRKHLRLKRPWESTQKTVIALGQASGGRGPHPAPPEGFGLGTLELLGGVCSQPFRLADVNKKRKTKLKKKQSSKNGSGHGQGTADHGVQLVCPLHRQSLQYPTDTDPVPSDILGQSQPGFWSTNL